MNYYSLFADAKFPKNRIKDVFDINPTKQATQKIGCPSQFVGHQFFALPARRKALLQRAYSLLQQFPLTLAPDQRGLPRSEIISCKRRQRCDQFRDSVAAARGYSKRARAALCGWVKGRVCRPALPLEIDLVSDHPDARVRCQFMPCASTLPVLVIDQPQHQVGFRCSHSCAPHAFLLDGIFRLPTPP